MYWTNLTRTDGSYCNAMRLFASKHAASSAFLSRTKQRIFCVDRY